MGGLKKGALADPAFVKGPEATDGKDRFIYDKANGLLKFDADGEGGDEAIVVAEIFGVLGARDLSAADIFIY